MKIRVIPAGAFRVRRKPLPPGSAADAALAVVGRRTRAAGTWVDKHAELLCLAALGVIIAAVAMLLLGETTKIIDLAREFDPVLQATAAVTTTLLGVFQALRWRRDRQRKKAAPRQEQLPLPAAGPDARQKQPPAHEPQPVPGGTLPAPETSPGNSG